MRRHTTAAAEAPAASSPAEAHAHPHTTQLANTSPGKRPPNTHAPTWFTLYPKTQTALIPTLPSGGISDSSGTRQPWAAITATMAGSVASRRSSASAAGGGGVRWGPSSTLNAPKWWGPGGKGREGGSFAGFEG